ncbi:ABC-type transport system, involved in lipoprotein release, permease component [Hahella chejuensis KCTC 2396]|uniref:ABC-type transport system, involved in lipoprotein release, permease component n=1 Tax=Hahella chejuensis (strain KCTC 2396) TaxID=349521 RepID=Q2SJK1_HAHCH|nr:lipoprotein-releasing ABC transporter permease subunit [Hahella chejuensis]ABC29173.1 ABC-type transport system, involved in lipoprotein release, permease component [Hahella chejuensis KCTC 2396]
MYKPLSLFIGLRYTSAKRDNHFISFISLTSMIGLILGVLVLITVMSVMNGFDRELRQRILGMVPHAVIKSHDPMGSWREVKEFALQHPQVEGVAPFVYAQGMATAAGNVHGIMINGIDPEAEKGVSIVQNHLISGSLDDLKPGEFGIVLGDILASYMRARVGDKITVILPEASVTPAGVFPRMKRFTVKGIFSVGAELDSTLAIINIEDAARIKRLGDSVEGVRLKLTNLFDASKVSRTIVAELGSGYYASDWTRTHGNLFQAIQMEKTMVGLLLMFIVAVAAFNIVSTLVMVVTDKKADIAILRTMGATPGNILRIFMVQGLFIGVVGTALGVLLGCLLAVNISDMIAWFEKAAGIQLLSSDVYFISYLPSDLQWGDVALISAVTLTISFVATMYPAWRASKIEPAEALRYE